MEAPTKANRYSFVSKFSGPKRSAEKDEMRKKKARRKARVREERSREIGIIPFFMLFLF